MGFANNLNISNLGGQAGWLCLIKCVYTAGEGGVGEVGVGEGQGDRERQRDRDCERESGEGGGGRLNPSIGNVNTLGSSATKQGVVERVLLM